MREDEDEDDDRVGLREGLRNRASRTGCGSRSLTVPAPLVPSGSSAAHDGRDEDRRLDGSSTSEIGCGSRSLAVPAPLVPSGSPGDDTSRRKQVRGAGSSGAEDWRELAEQSSGNEAAADADGDVQEDADAEHQTAMFARQASTYRPVIYPGWHFSAPPSAAWDPEPAWGGPEGNFHQRIPPRIRRQDFWFHDLRRRVVVRFHAKPRRKMFLPGPAGWPDGVAQHQLTGRRRTLAKLQSPEGHEILEDDWITAEKPTKMMARQWDRKD